MQVRWYAHFSNHLPDPAVSSRQKNYEDAYSLRVHAAVLSKSEIYRVSTDENQRNIVVRVASLADASQIAEIYNQGIQERIATFETELRNDIVMREWLVEHQNNGQPVLVASTTEKSQNSKEGSIVGWASPPLTGIDLVIQGSGSSQFMLEKDTGVLGSAENSCSLLLRNLRSLAIGSWFLESSLSTSRVENCARSVVLEK